MALVACHKCGHPVSEKAFQCPGCQQYLTPSAQTPGGQEPGREFGYKPATIVSYSNHLISIGQLMMLVSTLTGGYLGWKLTPLLAFGQGIPSDGDYITHMIIGALSGFLSVAWIAFLYIYVAQLSLCLLQIEKNSRR